MSAEAASSGARSRSPPLPRKSRRRLAISATIAASTCGRQRRDRWLQLMPSDAATAAINSLATERRRNSPCRGSSPLPPARRPSTAPPARPSPPEGPAARSAVGPLPVGPGVAQAASATTPTPNRCSAASHRLRVVGRDTRTRCTTLGAFRSSYGGVGEVARSELVRQQQGDPAVSHGGHLRPRALCR